MTVARSGACAASMPDGRVLVTGGSNENGALSSGEILSLGGSPVEVAPMSASRTGHLCVALAGGAVLVAGGKDSFGGALGSAEVFDPATGSWALAGGMTAGRAGATASLLNDGRVLIAGGESGSRALPSLEIFDPATGAFTAVSGLLSSPRTNHAAAVLPDGRVLIAGGSDGSGALDTVDVFDPRTGHVAPLGKLTTPRVGLTATTLLDGRVFLAGGNGGREDLASTEIYDPSSGSFSAAAPMDKPRRGHIALRIPHNNTILIAGGTAAGEPLAAAGLYVPWFDRYQPYGVMLLGRYAAAGTALNEGGIVLMAGGRTKNAATQVVEAAAAPTILTSKGDYAPGEWVTISGANWTPGNTVQLTVKVLPDRAVTRWQGTAIAAGDGTVLAANAFPMQETDLGETFELTAVEPGTELTAAAWVFTDSVTSVTITAPTSGTPVTVTSLPATVTVSFNYVTSTTGTTTGQADILGTSATTTKSLTPGTGSDSIQVTVPAGTANGSYNVKVTVTNSTGGGANNKNDNQNGAVIINVPTCTAPSISVQPAGAAKTVGESVTFSVTASGTTPLSYQWRKGGSIISGAIGSSYTISSVAAADAGIYDVVVSNSCGSVTSSPAALTVNKRVTATTLNLSPASVVIGQDSTVTVTVNDTSAGTKQDPSGTIALSSTPSGPTMGTCTLATTGTPGTSACTTTVNSTAAGSFSIKADFSETSVHLASTDTKTLTVTRRVSKTALSLSPASIVIGQDSTVTVTVEDMSAGTKQNPSGTIALSSSPAGPTMGTCTLSPTATAGTSSCTTMVSSAAAGSFDIRADFAETSVHLTSTDTKTLTVTRRMTKTEVTLSPSTVFVNQDTTVNVKVTDIEAAGAKSNPTGIVSISTGVGTDVITGTCSLVVSGTDAATCSVTLTPKLVNGGSRAVSATFPESAVHKTSNGSASLTVNPRTTSTAVSLAPGTVFVNQGSTVNVTVTDTAGAGTASSPAGTVSFTGAAGDNFSPASCTLASSGGNTASCSVTVTPSVNGSTHTINASYSPVNGAAGVHAGSSGSAGLTVNLRPTTIVLNLGNSSINEGSSSLVTVTVTDTAGAGGPLTPSGTVLLASSLGTDVFGACTLAQNGNPVGTATCSTTVTALDDRAPGPLNGYAGSSAHLISANFTATAVHTGSGPATASLTVSNVAPALAASALLSGPSSPLPKPATATITGTGVSFSDAGSLDTHTCVVNWDDGAAPEEFPAVSGACNGPYSHTYNGAGVYTVELKVKDDDGGVSTTSVKFEYVVVYDPAAGFVTGGGWINSPAGAYTADPSLSGKATFGFVSKYQKGAATPTGNTEFQFHAAKFNFRSTSYQWLVVSGSKAQYKGYGTVNGAGNYGFLLTATDGQLVNGPEANVDKFRIKIWDVVTSAVVYDNVLGSPDDMDAASPLAIDGGSIVIHSK